MTDNNYVGIAVGEVIDLADADVTHSKKTNEDHLRIILRADHRNTFITVFAPAESIGFRRGKVVSINKMYMIGKKYNGVANRQFVNVYVTLEETDEEPDMYAANSVVHAKKGEEHVEWQRPEFRKE